MSYSVSNNYITFRDGYLQVYGRRIYVEDGTKVFISLDSAKYGYVIVTVNLSANTVVLSIAENGSIYPTLTQENLMNGGNIYQFAICKYQKTTSSITLDNSFKPTKLETSLSVANSGYNRAASYVQTNYDARARGYADESTSTSWKYYLDQDLTVMYRLFIVNINDHVFVTIPGWFATNHSNAVTYYRLDGVDYKLGVEWLGQQTLILFTDNSSQKIKILYIY